MKACAEGDRDGTHTVHTVHTVYTVPMLTHFFLPKEVLHGSPRLAWQSPGASSQLQLARNDGMKLSSTTGCRPMVTFEADG